MPKPTGQIVPLKNQLASTVTLIRFADSSELLTNATTLASLQIPTTQGNGALYEDRVYDASGWAAGQSVPNVTPVITGLSGPPVLAAPTVSPTGGHLSTPCTLYSVVPADTSTRGQRAQYYLAQFPNSGTTNSVVLTFNIAGMTNVSKWYLSKTVFNPDGSTVAYSWYWTHSGLGGQTAFTLTDNVPASAQSGYTGTLSVVTGLTSAGGAPVANMSTAVTGTWTMTGAVSNIGGTVGYANGNYVPVSICAYNKMGATTNSAVQYVDLGYTDLIATGPTVTATPATTSGILAAGTYYYRVTATNAWGESTPGPEITGILAATGNITLSWSAVTGATGYNVYRGTATGTELMLASVTGVSCLDAGNPVSTIPLPTSASGCGPAATSSVTYSWGAVTNAVGYRLFTVFNTNYTTANAYALPTTTATTYTATGLEAVASVTPQVINNTGGNLVRVAKQITLNGASYITKIGMTFTPVAGKNYRAFVLYGGNMYSGSSWVTAPSNATQYLEFPGPPNVAMPDTATLLIGIEGADATCLIGLSSINVPVADWSGAFSADGGTWVGTGSIGATGMTVNAFAQSANSYLVPTVTSVYAGGSALTVPMRITRRLQNMTTQLSKLGTLSGLASPSNQYMCTTNYAYNTAIRSIIPSWAAAVGTAGTMLAEVSPDIGVTWYPLSNGVRFTFPTATTQMMFRYTVPGTAQTMTLMPGVNGLDASGAVVNVKNGYASGSYYTADTGQTVYYYNAYGGVENSMHPTGVGFAEQSSVRRSSFAITQSGTMDADVSAWIDTSAGYGIGGPFARSSISNTSCGYLLEFDSTGGLSLYALVNYAITSLPTALASFATGLPKANHRVRLITAGSHLLGLVDGRVYIDIVDSTIVAGSWAGVAGHQSVISSGFTVNSASTAAPAAQMESFSAFLEY